MLVLINMIASYPSNTNSEKEYNTPIYVGNGSFRKIPETFNFELKCVLYKTTPIPTTNNESDKFEYSITNEYINQQISMQYRFIEALNIFCVHLTDQDNKLYKIIISSSFTNLDNHSILPTINNCLIFEGEKHLSIPTTSTQQSLTSIFFNISIY